MLRGCDGRVIARWRNKTAEKSRHLRMAIDVAVMHWRHERLHRIGGGIVLLGDPVTAEFVFDTGATHSVISPGLAQRLGIQRCGSLRSARLADGSQAASFAALIGVYGNGTWFPVDCRVPVAENADHDWDNLLGMKGLLQKRSIVMSTDEVIVIEAD